MTSRNVISGGFTLERIYPVPPARLFRAWSDPNELRMWAAPASDWKFSSERYEFTIGGQEISRFGPPDEEPYLVNSRFDDIIPDQLFVTAFSISQGDTRISSTVLSVEFSARGTGTLLTLTEHGLFLDGLETAEMRQGGTETQLDQLEKFLAQHPA